MSENTKKKKFSINVFDVFIILIVLILIITLGYKIYSGVAEDKHKDDCEYLLSFECSSEYDSIARYIYEGDAVYIKSTGELLGYISKDADSESDDVIFILGQTESPTEDNTEEVTDADAQKEENKPVIYKPVDFRGELKLNGNTEQSRNGEYYTIEGYNITVGSEIEVYTAKVEFTITVKELSNIDE